ncbi:flagellar assembly protein FliW [Rossellomorea vietnamensis]|uniref:Flagellar assembly factor FliW n=1 Tax=Rossellomorea vietnamensis TaxID=218284 RepID=A0A5D4KGP8_9BACI|nr:flagellar assembly protein FliW [Rossellomorea vietnamensis]TYR76049.1 flagellar assembly protein FliW [Rossellomorea vietnamensis]
MKIFTKYHGEIDISQEDIWTFESGVPGFLEETQFVILPLEQIDGFSVLQSTKTDELGFVVSDPFQFFADYDFTLSNSTVELLSLKEEKNVKILSILTVKDPITETTANLQAPLILNTKNKKGKQVILNETDYKTKHFIFTTIQAVKG